jgi:hypothetical protein
MMLMLCTRRVYPRRLANASRDIVDWSQTPIMNLRTLVAGVVAMAAIQTSR